ncbi:MAG: phosphotransferase [Anaerolineae bacterium]
MTQTNFIAQIENHLTSLSTKDLTPLVSAVIGKVHAQVINCTSQRVSGGMGGGVGGTAIYRLQGDARISSQSDVHRWSLIAKILQARQGETPTDSHYWRREAEVYQSGILQSLAPHISAPRFIDITEYPGESCWLWLEDVPDDQPGQWTPEQHVIAARHLGQFSARYLQNPIPHLDWLSQNWIKQDVKRFGSRVFHLEELRQHPLVSRWLTNTTIETLQQLWDERELFWTALERLPETLCHYDAFRRNLLSHNDQTVMLDWSFVGNGPLGAELVATFWVNAIFEEIAREDLKTLDAALFESYITGIHDAGWRGDAQQIRLGYCAALGLRWLAGVGIQARDIAQSLTDGQPISPSYINSMTEAGRIIHERVQEARQLINGLE